MTAGRTNKNQLSRNWCTPPKYVEVITRFFDGCIELDPCSNEWSCVNAVTSYSLPKQDGLREKWNFKKIFVNPPYGADRERGTTIKDWLRKCYQAHKLYKSEVIALIPVATNTSHWKEYIFGKAASICFLYDTRLRFMIEGELDNKGAPMACAMVYWGSNVEKFIELFSPFGATLNLTASIGKQYGESLKSMDLF